MKTLFRVCLVASLIAGAATPVVSSQSSGNGGSPSKPKSAGTKKVIPLPGGGVKGIAPDGPTKPKQGPPPKELDIPLPQRPGNTGPFKNPPESFEAILIVQGENPPPPAGGQKGPEAGGGSTPSQPRPARPRHWEDEDDYYDPDDDEDVRTFANDMATRARDMIGGTKTYPHLGSSSPTTSIRRQENLADDLVRLAGTRTKPSNPEKLDGTGVSTGVTTVLKDGGEDPSDVQIGDPANEAARCDWSCVLVDRDNHVVRYLRRASSDAVECCRYRLKIYTVIEDESLPMDETILWSEDPSEWLRRFTGTEYHEFPPVPRALITRTEKDSNVVQDGASVSLLGLVRKTRRYSRPGFDEGSLFVPDLVLDADGRAAPAPRSFPEGYRNHWRPLLENAFKELGVVVPPPPSFSLERELRERTTVELVLERGCRRSEVDHAFRAAGFSGLAMGSRFHCANPSHGHLVAEYCGNGFEGSSSGRVWVTGDLSYAAQGLLASNEVEAGANYSLDFGVEPSVGVTLPKTLGVTFPKVTATLNTDEHNGDPGDVVLRGEGRAAVYKKTFHVDLNQELIINAEVSPDGVTAKQGVSTARASASHELRLRGETQSQPGIGRRCACGVDRCTYCEAAITVLVGGDRDPSGPSAEDARSALDFPLARRTDEQKSADAIVMIDGSVWLLERPEGKRAGYHTWRVTARQDYE